MKKKLVLSLVLVLVLILGLTGCSGNSSPSDATKYPEKPITMIIPYSAGGTTDLVGRQLAIHMEKSLGQTITVVNQGGASGSIGAKTVLDSDSDGYTVLFTAESLGTQRTMGLSEMSYADFSPIIVTANDPKVIVVNKSSKYNTLQELVDDMKANPGKVKMSYTGPGGSGHVQALIYNKFDLDMAMTAYTGGSDCIVAVLGDQVDFTNSNFSTVRGYIESGDLKLIGVSANERLANYPDVPTFSEIIPESKEYMDIAFTPLSLLVDKDVPADVQKILKESTNSAVKEADWLDFVSENSLDALYEKYPDEESARKFYSDWESVVSWLIFDAGAATNSPEKFNIKRP
ncbi:tripartite-type tricarboxylate transporter receptor subunit TctC [Sedimentibacter acidaminivorans]|jgi:putative tricarboxylic transport membrane protein|uniref:Tripartite-type tricarboxylate transporter receptor subunit TctC n=1 Tax=Sedimentibacter acidaminivorans TaxID=913099 RepID=A0ABS4GAM6_9FIRM|nr:tripartite tricarboxylate transporter substrate binding protein [Sedimentibacter acidaminivorans]MBP1924743.1 tripartite-type tricarboxylate transporter receptor subunit TctC [Sedimentibacter acidaminivorans]